MPGTLSKSTDCAETQAIPSTMKAAVYRGLNDVRLEEVPVPKIGRGEILVRVHTCGICGTDLKKIATGSHSAPRIFGHETSGVVARVAEDVRKFSVGDRVMVFHHIPCRECFYCRAKTFAQCETYKKVGCTAGFEPSGGGFAEYVRVMDWIVEYGTVPIPDGISFEQACFVEPVNTCMKGIQTLRPERGKTLLGSYSASVELQEQSVRFVMNREMDLEQLISHRFPLSESLEALHRAAHPQPDSMKIVIQPGSTWEGRSL